jgi:hypothetical protein
MRGAILLLVACSTPPVGEHASALGLDPRFEVRVSEPTIGANGHTKREVFVFGTKADGTFSTEQVVVGLDRATAGTLGSTTLRLGPLGASTHFTPCTQATANCLGPATITLARAADPTTIVATVPIDLVVPAHVSTAAPCRAAEGTFLYFDGQGGDYIRNGKLVVDQWSTQFADAYPKPGAQEIRLGLSPRKATQGNHWSLVVDTFKLATPLAVGMYANATRNGSPTPNTPGMSITGNAHGCNTITGAFEIHDVAFDVNGQIVRGTFTFEQHCEGDTTKLLEGCIRYEKP